MFRHLVTRHEAALIKHLARRLGDRDDANEAAQETMVRAYFSLPKLQNCGAFLPWLLGIADRVSLEMRRARRRQPTPLDVEGVSGLGQPDLSTENRRSDSELRQAVSELPEPYRQVILMRFYGGKSCSEISHTLGISLGTVTSRLSRAYALLREALRTHEQTAEVEP